MRGLGTLVNAATVLVGSGVGVLFGRRLPERTRVTVLHAVALLTIVNGITQVEKTHNFVFPIVALVLGAVVGEALRIEDRIEAVGDRVQQRLAKPDQPSTFSEGFVTASLVFCVGPLTILGSIQDGLGQGAQLLIVKAALDGLVAVVLASTLGWGVAASVAVIIGYQGGVTALAGVADRFLTARMIAEMTAAGGVMIMGIGVRLLDLKQIRVASLLPAFVIAPLLVALFAR